MHTWRLSSMPNNRIAFAAKRAYVRFPTGTSMIPVWSAFTTNSGGGGGGGGGDVVAVDGMSELQEPQPNHHLPAFWKLLSFLGCHPDPHVQPPNEAPDPCFGCT